MLRWGGDLQGGEPYVFQDPHDPARIVGFEVEIADALARRLGVRAHFVQNDWQLLIPSLERGDFDIVLNGLEVTEARRARVAFTRPYFAFAATLVVRRDEPAVRSLADLRGHRVGTLGGSLSNDFVAAVPGVDVVPYEGTEEPYLDLEQGRLDGVVLDDIIAERYGLVRPRLARRRRGGRGRLRHRRAARRAGAPARRRRRARRHGARRGAARDPRALAALERPAGRAGGERRGAGRTGGQHHRRRSSLSSCARPA